ncbi:MAG: AmmeMemoRadiSam system radical SAM enzyme [Elusimicrobia bacterium]|nr:AmmeMemoRadiSam system radical SAM enzyme [Candidatus Obscuribacterium magneticum]MCB4755885.1 AmmeMemoRadiSam system radical SAM enzyme [Candidatus Obscuribacterium magneticum]
MVKLRWLQIVFFISTAVAVEGAAFAAAWLISRTPPPATFSSLLSVSNPSVKEARYWHTVCAGVQCHLCPFECFLPEGARGRCRVRMNHGGRMVTLVYGHPVSVHIDPIEKKPVFHLLPGSWIYSLATMGCNLKCAFCQNWEISQSYPEQAPGKTLVPRGLEIVGVEGGQATARLRQDDVSTLTPQEVVDAALATRCRSIAYTYSEPVVFFEYMLETARLAKAKGLKNVMVSAGYIEPRPLAELAPYFDVIKIDLKGFDERFYRNTVGGELKYVLRTLKELKEHGVLTEIVNLVVPTLNDKEGDFKKLAVWVRENLGTDTPLFFSRFSPQYRMQNLPSTPVETLERAREIALKEGLHYVYVGNVPGHPAESTYCPACRQILVRRYGYAVLENRLLPEGRCPYDGTKIPGVWE